MYKIEQIQTGFDQIVNFKSVADSERYWKYFVENEDVIRAEYVNPLLIADTGYSLRQLERLDFLNCILPIPIFSERFVEKNGDTLKNDLLFLPCRVQFHDKILTFYMARILKEATILDVELTGRRQLTDGTWVCDAPHVYVQPDDDVYIVRDASHRSHYIVTEKFREISTDFRMEWHKLTPNNTFG